MLLKKVKETITKYGMLKSGDTVLIAVSGGPDSVCLLSILHVLSEELGLTLHVAHLDHRFRGRESADEALFVAKTAKETGIAATVEQFDVPAFCRERGLSAQAGAREVRYGFLNRVAEKVNASRIALGHTASDQAETLIMRLLRGAGLPGLSAIPPVRANIIRPLIEVTREEVMEYLRAQGLEFVTDPSNVKSLYTRNRVRSDIMPVLRVFNPRIVETLASEAAILRDENEMVEAYLAKVSPGIVLHKKDGIGIKRDTFNALLPALKRRILRMAVSAVGSDLNELSYGQIEDAIRFMTAAQTGRAMDLPSGHIVEREYDTFFLRPAAGRPEFHAELSVPGITMIPEVSLEAEAWLFDGPAETDDENYCWQAAFDYDKIGLPLVIRNRKPGDRFCPSGMGGKSKKLQDYFVDQKVPRRRRDTVPVLASKEHVMWVVGMRTDERFLSGAGTKRVLAVGVRKSA